MSLKLEIEKYNLEITKQVKLLGLNIDNLTFNTHIAIKYLQDRCEKIKSLTGPILESKGMRAIFQKKDKKRAKKGKIFENLGKNVQKFENILKKGSLMCATIACMKQLEYALLK